jgi:hypothetical protein
LVGAAIERLQRGETFRQKLAALDNPVLYVRERGLGLFIQRLPGQSFAQAAQRLAGVVMQALEPQQRFGERLEPARFHQRLARQSEQAVKIVCGDRKTRSELSRASAAMAGGR